MNHRERYANEPTWHGRVTIMELYHLTMSFHDSNWTLKRTAEFFNVSISLVSENIRLGYAISLDPDLLNCKTRIEALKKVLNEPSRYDKRYNGLGE